MGQWGAAEEVHIAYALSSWHPTAGTRASSRVSRDRRGDCRLVYSGGRRGYRIGPAPRIRWSFPEPIGDRAVIGEFTMADTISISRHLNVQNIHSYMTSEAVQEVTAPDAPLPLPVDERGRSAQTFLVEVIVRSQGRECRVVARGQDIYAVSAPLAVEAVQRILDGTTQLTGVVTPGEIFDPRDFLRTLAPHLSIEIDPAE